ncbi:MAG: amidohydrolase family protein, partial [Pseudolabrys sp.]
MQGKIALEEHFAIDDTLMDSKGFFPDDVWVEVRARVLDIHGRRVRLMDEFGIETMVLSLNAPAIQAIPDAKKANDIARKANDYLADAVRKQPDRFRALAALPLQDPDLAAKELQRCVKDLGMVGALANGFSQVGDTNTIAYYDQKQYWPFWAVQEQLDV